MLKYNRAFLIATFIFVIFYYFHEAPKAYEPTPRAQLCSYSSEELQAGSAFFSEVPDPNSVSQTEFKICSNKGDKDRVLPGIHNERYDYDFFTGERHIRTD